LYVQKKIIGRKSRKMDNVDAYKMSSMIVETNETGVVELAEDQADGIQERSKADGTVISDLKGKVVQNGELYTQMSRNGKS
jgi:hypothetical protein